MTRLLRAFGPGLLWAGLLLFLGSRPNLSGPTVDLPIDKLAHFCLYGILGALAGWGWSRHQPPIGRGWPVLAAVLVGVGDEWHQRIVPGRSAELGDLIADAAGILVGFVLFSRRAATARERGADES